MLKTSDLVKKNQKELLHMVSELKGKLLALRFESATGQLKESHLIAQTKKDIARIFTAIKLINNPIVEKTTTSKQLLNKKTSLQKKPKVSIDKNHNEIMTKNSKQIIDSKKIEVLNDGEKLTEIDKTVKTIKGHKTEIIKQKIVDKNYDPKNSHVETNVVDEIKTTKHGEIRIEDFSKDTIDSQGNLNHQEIITKEKIKRISDNQEVVKTIVKQKTVNSDGEELVSKTKTTDIIKDGIVVDHQEHSNTPHRPLIDKILHPFGHKHNNQENKETKEEDDK